MIETLSTGMELFKGPYFSLGAASRLRLSRTVQRTFFIIHEVGCKRSYIFQSSSSETMIDMDFNSGGMRPTNCGFRSLKGKASIVNPANKPYSLTYKVQQTFFVPAKKKKHELGEQHETRLLPKSHHSYRNVFYAVKMHNLSRNSNVRELNWKKLVDKKIKHCFIEWSNMI